MSVQYCEGIHGVTEYFTTVIFHCNCMVIYFIFMVVDLSSKTLSLRVVIPLCVCDKYYNVSAVKHDSCMYYYYLLLFTFNTIIKDTHCV